MYVVAMHENVNPTMIDKNNNVIDNAYHFMCVCVFLLCNHKYNNKSNITKHK